MGTNIIECGPCAECSTYNMAKGLAEENPERAGEYQLSIGCELCPEGNMMKPIEVSMEQGEMVTIGRP